MAPTPISKRPRFESAEFYAGALDVLEYLAPVAQETGGAGVWQTLFKTMHQNLSQEAKTKGFDLSKPD